MKYFVYKYLDENNTCIYIGSTSDEKDITRRMREHHYGSDRERQALRECKSILFAEVSTKENMMHIEGLLIELINPKYNVQHPTYSFIPEIANLVWKKWAGVSSGYEPRYNEEYLLLEEYKKLKEKKDFLSFGKKITVRLNSYYNKSVEYRKEWEAIKRRFENLCLNEIFEYEYNEDSAECILDGGGKLFINIFGFGTYRVYYTENKWIIDFDINDLYLNTNKVLNGIQWVSEYKNRRNKNGIYNHER